MLLERGADPLLFLDKYFFSNTRIYFEMLAFAVENVEYFDDLGTMFLFLPYEKLRAAKIGESALKDLKRAFKNEFARRVVGFPRGIILYEKSPGKIRGSGRGNNLHNKVSLPDLFVEIEGNGGGHFNAAAFRTEGIFEEVKKLLLAALQRRLTSI